LLVDGETTNDAVTVAAPCPCDPADLLDVEALVGDARADNDNDSIGLDPNGFSLVLGYVETTLPSGRYFVDQMGGAGDIIVNISGRVALFVDGSVNATGNLEFRIEPGGELDLFVKGDLVLTGRAVFGDADRPAASRIYVGGDGDVHLIGADRFVGNVYAPRSLVTAAGYLEMYGSLFARDFVVPGYANFVYDRSIQHGGDDCDLPPPPTDTCEQCGTCTGGTACVDDECGACRNDDDCCSPLFCIDGVCSEPVPIR